MEGFCFIMTLHLTNRVSGLSFNSALCKEELLLKLKLSMFWKYKHSKANCLGNLKVELKLQKEKQFLSYWSKHASYGFDQ